MDYGKTFTRILSVAPKMENHLMDPHKKYGWTIQAKFCRAYIGVLLIRHMEGQHPFIKSNKFTIFILS
jgi:hypothetical protein